MNEWWKTCNARICRTSRIWGAGSRRAGWDGYTLRVVREVRWVFSRRLKVSNVFDSLIVASNSFQIVGAEKLKERLLKLVAQKGIDRRFWLAKRRHCKGWSCEEDFWGMLAGLWLYVHQHSCILLGLHQISVPAPANPESSQVWLQPIFRSICRIWQMPEQLQYVQLIMDKTNVADLSRGVLTILISVIQKKNASFIVIPKIFVKNRQWCTRGSTELYSMFIAADSIIDIISFIGHIVLWSENKFSTHPALAPAEIEFLNPARSGSGRIWNSQIQSNA